jgi:hypothetical protein
MKGLPSIGGVNPGFFSPGSVTGIAFRVYALGSRFKGWGLRFRV